MTRGRRLLAQLALLGVLYLLDLADDAFFLDLIAVVLMVGPFASGTVAAILIWSSRQAPEIVSLRERADDAVTLLLASVGFALVGLLVIAKDAFGRSIPGRPVTVLLAYGALLVLIPGVTWLGTWRDVWRAQIRNDGGEKN